LHRLRLRSSGNARSVPGVRNGTSEANRGTRVKRRLLNVLAGLWLLLCIGTVLLWAMGHLGPSICPRHLVGRWSCRFTGSIAGNVSIGFLHDLATPNVGPQFAPGRRYTPRLLAWYDALPPGFSWRVHGFCVEDQPYFEIDASNHMVLVAKQMGFAIPYWVAWAMWIPLFFPAARLRRQRILRDRIGKGLCVECGYDLRATPDRCPECGTVPPKKEIASA
jgi:hypothetical protein